MKNAMDARSPFTEDLWVVLGRYASGESSVVEAEQVRRWLAEDPRRQRLMASLEQVVRSLARAPLEGLDTESQWRRLAARLDEPDVVEIESRRIGRYIYGLRAAAVVLLAVGVTLVWYRIRTRGALAEPTVVATVLNYQTRVGQTDSVGLPDGTRVVLGPDSRLTVAAEYGSQARDVRLAGEAFFRVAHDAAHRFRVRAATAVIEDLGTSFAVRDDGGDVHVAVESGAVSLRDSAAERGLELRAGDRGTLARGVPTVERAAATPDDMAWTRGRLIFTGASMTAVAADFRRWYGIELTIADPSISSKHLTASFAGESADQALHMIGLALGATIERHGNTAVLRTK
jgi:ferric-dicitrate binding protein FerR (iron transport regulator)